MWIATGRGKSSGLFAIHSSGQTVFSLSHTEGITLGAGEEVMRLLEEPVAWVWIG